MRKKTEVAPEEIGKVIIESITEKKGQEIIEIDLSALHNSVCEYFIISHGDSSTQVRAIAENIEEKVRKDLNQKVLHREGYENAQWILLDYNDVVVHIFQKEIRYHFKLEELWADGKLTVISGME